jgi:lipoate-protein ligase A
MPPTGLRPFRFLYSGIRDSFTNMAMDEAVLIGLREKKSAPILRIYKWTPPTITIGYFQNIEDIDLDLCREDDIGVVRRLTGGRAVLHNEEMTYSILFSQEDFQPFRKREIFVFIAHCLIEALARVGIESKIAQKTRGDVRSANCFASSAQYEVESSHEGKLIGSAQLIRNGVLLQHGAIPITRSYSAIAKYLQSGAAFTKAASSLSEVAGEVVTEESLLSALRTGFADHLPLVDGDFTEYENDLIAKLTREKYSTTEWNMKR